MDEKNVDPSAPPYMPPPYEAQQAYPAQPGYPPTSQPGYPPTSQPGYPPTSQPGYPPQQSYPAQPGYIPPGYPAQPEGGSAPQGYPPQGYPPQQGQSPAYPQGYAAPSHVVMQQPPVTVVIPPPQQPKPPNNLPLALIACLCCNGCCIGLVALVFALRSDSAFSEGRVDEARRKGETAKKCAIVSIVMAIIMAIVYLIIQVIG